MTKQYIADNRLCTSRPSAAQAVDKYIDIFVVRILPGRAISQKELLVASAYSRPIPRSPAADGIKAQLKMDPYAQRQEGSMQASLVSDLSREVRLPT
jgi:hypothetical protein